jgi:hypothetical protein
MGRRNAVASFEKHPAAPSPLGERVWVRGLPLDDVPNDTIEPETYEVLANLI